MTHSRQQHASAQTGSPGQASGFILAKVSNSRNCYFFTGQLSKANTPSGTVLVGQTGLFPADAFEYENPAAAQQIAKQLNNAGIGSHWHVVPASTPYEIPFAPVAHPDVKEIAPPA
jgi:hypothetical protein